MSAASAHSAPKLGNGDELCQSILRVIDGEARRPRLRPCGGICAVTAARVIEMIMLL